MTSQREQQRLIGALAMLIDSDEPPGLAARDLARTVVSLIRDREAPEAVLIATALARVAVRFPRKRSGEEVSDDGD